MVNTRKQLNKKIVSRLRSYQRGLTLLETVLSLAIFGILLLGIITAIARLQANTDLDMTAFSWVESLRRAEELSRAVQNDSSWGAKIATATITIFKGTSFAARDSSFDEVLDITGDISISGADEFVFTRLAATTTAGTTTLTHSLINESRTISINSKGNIEL
jgi:prepilin-type N-terminal cleavage/methylation domain-containing protein